jgi:hypothetical protein
MQESWKIEKEFIFDAADDSRQPSASQLEQ